MVLFENWVVGLGPSKDAGSTILYGLKDRCCISARGWIPKGFVLYKAPDRCLQRYTIRLRDERLLWC